MQCGASELGQITDELAKAERVYEVACERFGDEAPEAQAALKAMEKVKENLLKFLERRPELRGKALF